MSYATWPIDPPAPLWPALTLKLKRSEKSKNFSPEKTKKSINIHSAFGTSFTYFCLRKKLFPCFSLSHLHPSQGAFFSAFLLTAERQEQKNTTTHCSCISITSASFIHFLVARVKDDALKTLRVPYCLFGFIAGKRCDTVTSCDESAKSHGRKKGNQKSHIVISANHRCEWKITCFIIPFRYDKHQQTLSIEHRNWNKNSIKVLALKFPRNKSNRSLCICIFFLERAKWKMETKYLVAVQFAT